MKQTCEETGCHVEPAAIAHLRTSFAQHRTDARFEAGDVAGAIADRLTVLTLAVHRIGPPSRTRAT
jgi:hypothetical protein